MTKHKSFMNDATGQKKTTSVDRQLTVMLLLVTFALLLLTGPQYLRYLIYLVVDKSSSPKTYAVYVLIFHTTNKFSVFNSSVNIFLYCLGGAKFRQEALALLTCGRYGNDKRSGFARAVTAQAPETHIAT